MKYTELLVVHGGLISATPAHHHLSEPSINLLHQRADEPEGQHEHTTSQTQCNPSPESDRTQTVQKSSSSHSHSSSLSSSNSSSSTASDGAAQQMRPEFKERWSSSWRDLKAGVKQYTRQSHGQSDSKSGSE